MLFGRFNRMLILWGASCGIAMADPAATSPRPPSQAAPAAKSPGTPAAPVKNPAVPAAPVKNPAVQAAQVKSPAVPAAPVKNPAVPAAPVKNPAVPAAQVKNPAVPAAGKGVAVPAAATQAPAAPAPQVPAAPATNPAAFAQLERALSAVAAEKSPTPSVQQKAEFLQALTQLKAFAHPIESSMINAKADPILMNLQVNPQAILSQAERLIQVGGIAQAQHTAVGLIRVCAECHATTVAKPVWKQLQPQTQLSEFERGQFYKIVGKDNEALLSLERVMNSRGLAASRRDIWERAATSLVGLAIRREDSPYTFVDILSNALGSAGLPPAQKDLVSRWRSAGKAWEKEAPARNAAEALQKAQVLMNFSRTSKDPQSSFIESARAMNLLRLAQTGPAKGQAFRLAGELRERLSPDGIWFNTEDYYQACIRSAPKTVDASQCWDLMRSLPQRNKSVVLNDEMLRQLQPLAR